MAFAVLEGIALGIRSALRVLRDAGSPVDELRVAGGGGRLASLGQLKADVLGIPVLHLDADAATIGAALLAGRAAGLEGDTGSAMAAVLGRATRFEPSDRGGEIEAARAAWFDSVRQSDAVRMPPGSEA